MSRAEEGRDAIYTSKAVGLHSRLQDHAGSIEVRSLVWSCALGLGHGKV